MPNVNSVIGEKTEEWPKSTAFFHVLRALRLESTEVRCKGKDSTRQTSKI